MSQTAIDKLIEGIDNYLLTCKDAKQIETAKAIALLASCLRDDSFETAWDNFIGELDDLECYTTSELKALKKGFIAGRASIKGY